MPRLPIIERRALAARLPPGPAQLFYMCRYFEDAKPVEDNGQCTCRARAETRCMLIGNSKATCQHFKRRAED
jgi:hypothetical protein